MNDFLHVLVGLVFGAGASYLFSIVHGIDRRRRRIEPVRKAMHALYDAQQYLVVERNRAGFHSVDADALHAHYRKNFAVVATYIADEYAATHTREELRAELAMLQEGAP